MAGLTGFGASLAAIVVVVVVVLLVVLVVYWNRHKRGCFSPRTGDPDSDGANKTDVGGSSQEPGEVTGADTSIDMTGVSDTSAVDTTVLDDEDPTMTQEVSCEGCTITSRLYGCRIFVLLPWQRST